MAAAASSATIARFVLVFGPLLAPGGATSSPAAPRPTVVVSGASEGVGRRVAERFARRGWTVVAIARTRARLDSLAADVAAHGGGGTVLPVACDIAHWDALSAGVLAALDAAPAGPLCPCALVHSAALYARKPFAEFDVAEVDRLIDVNLKGAMYLTKAVLPRMLEARAGRLVFINSVAGLPTWTIGGESVYAASKHGLSGYADCLGNELRAHGIGVTSIHPGGVDTPLQERAGASADVRASFLSVDDVADAVEHVVDAPAGVLLKRLELFSSAHWH